MIRYSRYVEPEGPTQRAPVRPPSVKPPSAETVQKQAMPDPQAALQSIPEEPQSHPPIAGLLPDSEPLELTASDNEPAKSGRKRKPATRKAKARPVVNEEESALPLLTGLEG